MAPLVVIRAGAKEVEYRDPRAVWKRTMERLLREGEESDDGSSCGESESEEEEEEEQEDERRQSIYGFSTELRALEGMRVFRCVECANVVADRDDVIAKSFFGRTGKAYLMNAMFNVRTGPSRNRYLMTGMHTICDVVCKGCDGVLGWKYLQAMEASQKYKEGKFIMERAVVHDRDEDEAWGRG